MNSAKHTPGPWEVKVLKLTTLKADVYALTRGGLPHGSPEANATLMSAAPELLAACKEVIAVCQGILQSSPTNETASRLLGSLYPVVLKAEGLK